MAVQWQWIPPVMLPWSEISLYPHYADVDWIGSEFVPSKTGHCPHFQGSDSRITEVVSWKLLSHRGDVPWRACSPDLSTCDFLWGYLKGKVYVDKPRDSPQLKNAIKTELRPIPRRMCEQVFTNFSEAERVRQKPGSSFKRRYFLCLTMFWNIRMVFLNCNISCIY